MADSPELRAATALQAGMSFHATAHPGTGVDIEQIEMIFDGHLDADRFVGAFNSIVAENDILRTALRSGPDGSTMQAVFAEAPIIPTIVSDALASDRALVMHADRYNDFNLETAPLQRLHIAEESDHTWVLWSFHHSLLDGRSFPLVLDAVFDMYDGVSAPGPIGTPFQTYVDAVTNQSADTASYQTAFWRKYLADLENPTTITVPPPDEAGARPVDHLQRCLGRRLSDELRALAERYDVTVNNVVQAGWILLLHHYSQSSSVVTGTTRACRHAFGASDDMIGLLINTIPFRVDLSSDMTVVDLLTTVQSEQRRLREVETTPLPQINQVSPLGRTALFDSIVMFDEATLNSRMADRLGDRSRGRSFTYTGQTNFDFTLLAYNETEILIRLEYSTSRLNQHQAEKILDELTSLLDGFAAEPSQKAVGVPYLTEAEKELLAGWNDSSVDYDLSQTLPDLFAAQAAATPNLPALTFGDATLTYAQFDAMTNQLGHHLQRLGVKADLVVGVCAERSLEMLLAIHAIHKAGGAYVPLDPDHPADRLAYMVENAEATIVLCQSRFAGRFDTGTVVVIDADDPAWSAESTEAPERSTRAHDLAYTLYTSGSTGRPKGAMNEHAGIVNRLLWMQDAFGIGPEDVVLQKTPFSFDVSVWELFWPTIVGARTVIAPPGAHKDPAELIRAINDAGVTTIHFVPSMLQIFLSDPNAPSCTSLKRVICSGEALTRDLQDRFFKTLPQSELHNLYGPTEAAIDVTWWQCDPASELQTVPIGRTIANTQIHILDPQLEPLPIGVPGELHIGGIQVARGYRNNAELTARQFVPDPHSDVPNARLYKTGDLARFMPDGNVEYLGRLDHQVKIRGLRIELGEIESVISDIAEVGQCVVTTEQGPTGDARIVAYVTGSDPDRHLDTKVLTAACEKRLTTYMMPADWMILPEFPLNTSGKVDRKRLPKPELRRERSALVPAQNTSQKKLLELWSEILGHDEISVDDAFFDVGGDSLKAARLLSQINTSFEIQLALSEVVANPTISAQANLVNSGHAHGRRSGTSEAIQAQKTARTSRKRRGRG
jgi:amino acid adenylation domain-containing protein